MFGTDEQNYKPRGGVRVLIALALIPIGIVGGFFATYIYVSAATLMIGIIVGDLKNASFDPQLSVAVAFISGFFLTFIPLRKWIYAVLHRRELKQQRRV